MRVVLIEAHCLSVESRMGYESSDIEVVAVAANKAAAKAWVVKHGEDGVSYTFRATKVHT